MLEFSLAGYSKLLSTFKERGYIFSRFDEIDSCLAVERPFVILRHDIDISLRPALEIARIEHEHGVQAAYFVWLHSPFYNLLNRLNVEIVRKIHAYGHQIALHVDLASYDGDCAEALMEIDILSKFYPYVDTQIASLHTPGDLRQLPIASHRPLYNVYGSALKGDIAYISDSAGRWLYTHPLDTEAFYTGKPIQLLTHPIWWHQNGETPRKKLELWLHNDYMHTYATAKEFLPKLFSLSE